MGISIALTKGRLEKEAINIFEAAGFGVDNLKDKGRKLVFEDTKYDINYFLVKSNDCITYVEHGVADVGIVGLDSLLEKNNNCYELMDLGVGKCKFIVAALPDKDLFKMKGHIKIGTKYPKVAKDYFKENNIDVEIVKIEGSVELAPILKLCDGIVDIMETGTTLKENGLVVLREIKDISARLIVNKASFKLKKKEIDFILESVKEVLSNK
ncbi:MAG: ATP phosphoribosyltransferase [Clostridium sp.]|uniref:ATP phosphoribosyltransferase n=1 Tax=Clostridium sp. TaxID=1506 RepID=UPI0025C5A711|nr:ATP phosphoribosyltransferase [Clostridium sp.]MCF0147629.1 ATP phosphoribosyltransferase [Clostridium sp.]